MEKKGKRGKQADDIADELEEEVPDLLGDEDDVEDLPEGETDPKIVAPPDDDVETEGGEEGEGDALGIASDMPVQVVAVLGKKGVSMRELLDLRIGQVVSLGRPLNEVVDLVANGKLVARGELVDIDGQMGVKIIKMLK